VTAFVPATSNSYSTADLVTTAAPDLRPTSKIHFFKAGGRRATDYVPPKKTLKAILERNGLKRTGSYDEEPDFEGGKPLNEVGSDLFAEEFQSRREQRARQKKQQDREGEMATVEDVEKSTV